METSTTSTMPEKPPIRGPLQCHSPPDSQIRSPPPQDPAQRITIDSPCVDHRSTNTVELLVSELLAFTGRKWAIPLEIVPPKDLETLEKTIESHGYKVYINHAACTFEAMAPPGFIHSAYLDWIIFEFNRWSTKNLDTFFQHVITAEKEVKVLLNKGRTLGLGNEAKYADAGFVGGPMAPAPRGIVEVGVSQIEEELEVEATDWLRRGAGDIRWVLLINVTEKGKPSSEPDLPEGWEELVTQAWATLWTSTIFEKWLGKWETRYKIIEYSETEDDGVITVPWTKFDATGDQIEIPMTRIFSDLLGQQIIGPVLLKAENFAPRKHAALMKEAMLRRIQATKPRPTSGNMGSVKKRRLGT